MSFTGTESEVIALEDATDWTSNYRSDNPGEIKAHFFGKNKLNLILNQTGCVGIRAYYAIDKNGIKQLVFVGVDSSEEDLYNGVILDRSIPCPNHCGTSSPLT